MVGGRAAAALRRLLPPESFPRHLARYVLVTLRQAHEDSIWLIASAIALVTLLSLIPLLAAFSFIGARVFSQYPQRSLEVFVQILPYSEKTVVDTLGELLGQAGGIHGVGVIFFFTSSLFLFVTVEETLNRIWNVLHRRPLRVRLFSFALFFFWGPILVGATFTSLLLLRQSPAFRRLAEDSFLLTLAPFLATVIGLTVLYWLVPYAPVRLRNALAGGLLAAILLEVLRQSFGLYVKLFSEVNEVYGGFAFAILFIISLDLTWGIVLLGCEAAYTAQHFRLLSQGLHRNPPVQAAWVGLAALALIARQLVRGEPVLSREELADRLTLPERELERILHPLIVHELLRPDGESGYLLAHDPQSLAVEQVFAAYDHRARRGVGLVGGELTSRLEELVGEVSGCRADRLEGRMLADLVAEPAET
ncbi:MAG TPA: YhjD/YihY/BrkB family envelope integrity protein [Thermoanaerobaculia bacterium]|nr:YhjD/YihY/BrkB family envelope integrity protein [Thermoanaerobaculia bacterium]